MKIAPAIESSAPDWSTVPFHPRCPLCDYDLYGSQSPRCSECGYPFEWSEVVDPRLDVHPYLFEKHPEANIWSYWKTFKNAFRARSFWSQLHPAQRPNTRRLVYYWIIGSCAYLLSVAIQCMLVHMAFRAYLLYPSKNLFRPAGFTWWGQIWATLPIVGLEVLFFGVLPLVGTWLFAIILMGFRLSMRRARVRSSHVLRAVIYSCDPAVGVLFVTLCGVVPALAFIFPKLMESWSLWQDFLIGLPAAMIVVYRLWTAFRVYLRFDHALAVIVAAACIVGLIAVNVYYKLTLY